MQAIREIVTRDIFTGFEIPKEFGERFEMILVPIVDIATQNSKVLKKQEDTINEDLENRQFLTANYNMAIKEDENEDEIWGKYL